MVDTRADIGPKADSLRRLAEAGLWIPDAKFLGVGYFRDHARRAGLPGLLSDPGPIDAARAREAILGTEMSPAVEDLLRRWHHTLGDGHVAVRSSADAEDLPEASFAGQHGTYFAADADSVIARVRDCWASLFSDRAVAYRERNSVPHGSVSMAVIVQRLVPAVSAGVAFTVNPLDGSTDVCVESCFGIGEALVSGKVTPDRFVVSRDGLEVRETVLGNKPVRVVEDGTGTVSEQPVGEKEALEPSIDEATVRGVARLALRAEDLFGVPVDVEWAFDGKRVWLLQARPITTLAKPASAEAAPADLAPVEPSEGPAPAAEVPARPVERPTPVAMRAGSPAPPGPPPIIWSNVNTGEILPDVASPMTWTVIHGHAQDVFCGIFDALGVKVDASGVIGLVGGRIYFNLSMLRESVARFPGLDATEMLGGMQEFVELPPMTGEGSPSRLGALRAALAMPGYVRRHSPRRADRFVTFLKSQNDSGFAALSARPDAEESYALLEGQIAEFKRFNEALAYMLVAMMGFTALGALTRRWLGDATGTLANRLVAGRGDVTSAEAGHALWRLSELARDDDRVRAAVSGDSAWPAVRRRLERLAAEGADAAGRLLDAWDAFMETHGHHRRGELEFANPTWAERPDYVLGVVRGYVEQGESNDPMASYAARAADADAAAEECVRRLRDPLRRAVFRRVLAWGRGSARSRENVKSEAIRWLVVIRFTLLALADRLVERGALEYRDDIFFLEYEELRFLVDDPTSDDWRALVTERRAEHERFSLLEPPPVVVGEWDESAGPWKVPADTRTLKGIAVSSGVARGPARVFLSADTDEAVLAGEILVAPFTDPGWTPYFVPAAGIVMDMGGLLSHGSIIAREYGIPAVVNVGPATRLIRTGQLIEVDGDTGEVRILE